MRLDALEYLKRKPDVDIFLDAVEFYSSLRKCETTYTDELRAKELQCSYPRLEFFDRVYVAQMERLKLTEIYSNDRALDAVKGIKRIFSKMPSGHQESCTSDEVG